ncbi:hypothetical protein BGZ76_009823 [Entomortierella beljakovae]|nr:hypothetical protein BGZ76_009823 [Entomortierella beljakovae]
MAVVAGGDAAADVVADDDDDAVDVAAADDDDGYGYDDGVVVAVGHTGELDCGLVGKPITE